MRKPAILITGASGEIGHELIRHFAGQDAPPVLALDLRELEPAARRGSVASVVGSVLDGELLARVNAEYEITAVFHLAALLSTRSEFTPAAAHQVNVQGTLNVLELAIEQARWSGRTVKVLFPSSIAVYGLPDPATKERAGRVKEHDWNTPTTIYGCNKLYCEHLGRYFARHYRQLAADGDGAGVDFRCLRFPGLISATTLPSGGTSDYAPEMLHFAAHGEPYECFVRPDARIPFMSMPDAVRALLDLAAAPKEALSACVYNVTAFAPSAAELADVVKRSFPKADTTFRPHAKRQAIVDTWPADVDDSRARQDWGWAPRHDLTRAFEEYLVPTIRERYGATRAG